MTNRMLLIEDNRDMQILMKEIVEINFQVEVAICSSGSESLRMLEGGNFQMVITDYRIHEFAKKNFFENVRNGPLNKIPMIVYSGDRDISLPQSDKLKIVCKPDFVNLIQEIRSFKIFSERAHSDNPFPAGD